MNRERLVSVVGGRASKYVMLKKPSQLIPFRGKFPLLEPYQNEAFHKAIQETENIEDLSQEFQDIVMKGSRIALLEEGFQRYLFKNGLQPSDFLKLKNSDKSDYLMNWMNEDCIDFSQLTIK